MGQDLLSMLRQKRKAERRAEKKAQENAELEKKALFARCDQVWWLGAEFGGWVLSLSFEFN